MPSKVQQFIRERQYLTNISTNTIEWHTHCLKWLPSESPTEGELKEMVMRMREKGLKATGCNSVIRSINAYLKWAGSSLKIPKMKEEQRVLPTFRRDDIQSVSKWKPATFAQYRLHTLILLLADVGCRIDEALSLQWTDVDFDNLLVTLHGKGRKDRTVPFSYELRKWLWKWKQRNSFPITFPTTTGTKPANRKGLHSGV